MPVSCKIMISFKHKQFLALRPIPNATRKKLAKPFCARAQAKRRERKKIRTRTDTKGRICAREYFARLFSFLSCNPRRPDEFSRGSSSRNLQAAAAAAGFLSAKCLRGFIDPRITRDRFLFFRFPIKSGRRRRYRSFSLSNLEMRWPPGYAHYLFVPKVFSRSQVKVYSSVLEQ